MSDQVAIDPLGSLCFRSCKRFTPDLQNNCRIFKELYALSVRESLVIGVVTCPKFIVAELEDPGAGTA